MPPLEPKKRVRIRPVLRAYTVASLKHPWLFAITLFGVALAQASAIIAPIYIKEFINAIAGTSHTDAVVHATLLILAAFAGISFIGWAGRRTQAVATQRMESRVMAELEDEAFSTLIKQDYDFFI